ncbi:MAG: hypothetical protein U1F53_08060 [Burkholderiaceae bacterium]
MIIKLVSAVALSLLAATAVQAKPMNIALDGYCNTFTLNTSGSNVYGIRSGCGYDVIDGGVVGKVDGNKVTTTNDTNDGSLLFTWIFSKAVGGSGTWQLYGSNGTSTALYNSGTYSLTTEAAGTRAGKDVTRR